MAFNALDSILDFLEPVTKLELSGGSNYKNAQIGNDIFLYEKSFPDIENVDLILIGCNEMRGAGIKTDKHNAANDIRSELFSLYNWHTEIKIADVGNIRIGATLQDSYAALQAVLSELFFYNKKILIIGGSHDLMLAQYQAHAKSEKIIEAVCVDAKINIDEENDLPSENFLMKLLTAQPNFVRHYSHIGFQSYFVHPQMLQIMDKLHFDCFRVGKVKENIDDMEPVIRNANIFGFDISAIKSSDANSSLISPNGFSGEEACTLMQFAGMSDKLSAAGIYGYLPQQDKDGMTAKQISQMIWYFIDGIDKSKEESSLNNSELFYQYHLAFAEMESIFLQSKKTGRWWMQLPDEKYIACSLNDYMLASQNEIPERWLRAVERS